MASRALVTAGIAAGVLVIVLAADVSMTSTYTVDVWTGAGWRELAREPYRYEERPFGLGPTTISANRSEDVRLRVGLDNGYFWDRAAEYRVFHGNAEVASGAVAAASRSRATSEFTIPASALFEGAGRTSEPVVRPADGTPAYVSLGVEVDGERLYVSFTLQEVARS